MDANRIEDEYSKQTIQLSNNKIVNIFDREQFINTANNLVSLTDQDSDDQNHSTLNPSNPNLVLMFFTPKQQETLYRTFPLVVSKNKSRCYLNDIFIGLFDITQMKFMESSMKYLLNPNAKAIKYLPVTANMLSDIGKHFVGSFLLGTENLKSEKSLAHLSTSNTDSEVKDTLTELMNAHEKPSNDTPTQQQQEVTFVEQKASLTEVTEEVVEKVKSGISSIATTVDNMSKKQNVYIILERRYLSENKAIQIYHIYSNKKLVASTLADEFAPILLSLINKGQIRIKEVEEIVTENGEWEVPKRL